MRNPLSALLAVLLAALSPLCAQEGFKPLFDGKTLAGWDGNPELWTVEDGAITGKTKGPDHLAYNQFLIWRGGVVKNFELRAKIKCSASNSGIQYRSKELPEAGKWVVGGYQCDVHANAPYNGMVYEERGRGILVQNGQNVVIDDKGDKWLAAERDAVKVDFTEWHEYVIIAQGNHLIHKVDGKVTIDLVDHQEKNRTLEGLLAFQVHKGPAMIVQIKDVVLKELPDSPLITLDKSPIPSDAQRIVAPAAKKAAPKAAAKAPAKGKAKAPAKKAPASDTGKAIGENKATPVGRIKAPAGFKVELLYSVPGAEQGSWVALCTDDKGRIYASDQYGDLYRFPAPAAGETLKAADIKKMPVNIRAINGMTWAFGALYAGVNDYEKKIPSGFYRLSDSDGDDQIDKVELLRDIQSGGDHGVHKVVVTPDQQGFYLICGNNAVKTETPTTSPVAPLWGDDHLLPRMPDGRGHNRHVLAPGGIVYRISKDGKTFETFASGFRNIYGGALNRAGDLFTYDADMEYDFNTPWYRPTRVNHVVSGGEYGWRNGAGKYPEFYADNLPATVNIGPGSPTGIAFGYGAKFPAKYQEALYIMDWSWGKIYAVHLNEKGASYAGTKEDFILGAPLPVTDLVIHPADGAMYFAIGGRKVQSGLYRVTYVGKESTAPVKYDAPAPSAEVIARKALEQFHGKQDPKAADAAWPHLSSSDRWLRSAARVVLEHQPAAGWAERAFAEQDATARLEALLALARQSAPCPYHTEKAAKPDPRTGIAPTTAEPTAAQAALRDRLLATLRGMDFAKLTKSQKLTHARLAQIVLHRYGKPDAAGIAAVTAQYDAAYPAADFELNWILTETLSFLQSPTLAAKGMALVADAGSQEPEMEYMRSLRMLKAGWTPALREAQLNWFVKAASYRGGSSFGKFIEFIRNDSLATFTPEELARHEKLIALAKNPPVKSAYENVGAIFAGRTPKNWTLEELSAAASTGMKGRDFENGRKMFGAAACFACHRYGNAGGMNGPDLTGAGGRYSPHDLLDQIINPSKEINEQFAPVVVTKTDGTTVTGVIVNLNGDTVQINTDLSDPDQRVGFDRKQVKSIEVSKVSPMPPMLLSMLTKDEVLDLVAFILSGGDKENAAFKK
ncbi:MAG: family 16 glycoside hydrolase [Opitutales bacterium]|jgi:putative heme-binding domain-containing protein